MDRIMLYGVFAVADLQVGGGGTPDGPSGPGPRKPAARTAGRRTVRRNRRLSPGGRGASAKLRCGAGHRRSGRPGADRGAPHAETVLRATAEGHCGALPPSGAEPRGGRSAP